VISDPTGGETGTAREMGGIVHRLQGQTKQGT
jgi:hypothetical protein